MITMLLVLEPDIIAAEVIKKNAIASPVPRNRDAESELIYQGKMVIAPPIHGCRPIWLFMQAIFLNLIRPTNPFLKYVDVRGPPDLRAVAHRLRTSGLDRK